MKKQKPKPQRVIHGGEPKKPAAVVEGESGVYVRVPLSQEQIASLREAWDIVEGILSAKTRAETLIAKALKR